jgi:hypothetical protein
MAVRRKEKKKLSSIPWDFFVGLQVEDKPIATQEVLAGGRFYVTTQRKI